jgi:hypothetical protein
VPRGLPAPWPARQASAGRWATEGKRTNWRIPKRGKKMDWFSRISLGLLVAEMVWLICLFVLGLRAEFLPSKRMLQMKPSGFNGSGNDQPARTKGAAT